MSVSEAEEQRRSQWPAGKAMGILSKSVSLENPHDGLTGIDWHSSHSGVCTMERAADSRSNLDAWEWPAVGLLLGSCWPWSCVLGCCWWWVVEEVEIGLSQNC